jgi:hypothetical protein
MEHAIAEDRQHGDQAGLDQDIEQAAGRQPLDDVWWHGVSLHDLIQARIRQQREGDIR